eukprot:scaffold68310_cov68-Phaeocystis_antarctica.AAC.2
MPSISRDAPAAISARKASTFPFPAARCSGVNTYLPCSLVPTIFASREAPVATSTWIAFVWPLAAARCSMVVPRVPSSCLPNCILNSAMWVLMSPPAACNTTRESSTCRV